MQSELKHVDFDSLGRPMVKFIRNNPTKRILKDPDTGNILTDDNGKIKYVKKGGKKTGVLVAGIHPEKDYKVVVGFSMCCKKDRYNWIQTGQGKVKVDGFGKTVATKRALKWEDFSNIWVGKVPDEISDRDGMVSIPESISEELGNFINRVKLYYKDKDLPLWLDSMIIANEIIS